MQLARRDADFGTHAEFAAIGKLGRRIVHDDGAIDAGEKALGRGVPIHAQMSIRTNATLLSEKLNELISREPESGGKEYVATFANSGTEAVEAAIKHALMRWNHRREVLRAMSKGLSAR